MSSISAPAAPVAPALAAPTLAAGEMYSMKLLVDLLFIWPTIAVTIGNSSIGAASYLSKSVRSGTEAFDQKFVDVAQPSVDGFSVRLEDGKKSTAGFIDAYDPGLMSRIEPILVTVVGGAQQFMADPASIMELFPRGTNAIPA